MYGHRMMVKTRDGIEVTMRPCEPDDAPAMATGFQSWTVTRYLGPNRGGQTITDEKEFIERVRTDADAYLWGIEVPADDGPLLIGTTSIKLHGDRWVSGIAIWDHEWWGKGVASATHLARTLYAFTVLNLLAIDSGVVEGNEGSLRALKGIGYRQTGIDYSYTVIDGHRHDAIRLTLVNPNNPEWNMFWRGGPVPSKFKKVRPIARAALERSRAEVKFL